MKKQTLIAPNAPVALGPYSHANIAGNLVFTSGQLGIDPENGKLATTVAGQTAQALKNISSVLAAAGTTIGNVVKTTIYITDMKRFGEVNEEYAKVFSENYPARTCVQVAALPVGGDVEIEAIAVI